jgi:integrase
MYRTAVGVRAAAWNPFDGDALPRPPADRYTSTEAVTDDIAHRVIATAAARGDSEGERDEVLLRLLYDTGMRRSEAAKLKRENVIRREERVVVGFYGKGGKWHEVMLPKATADVLTTWMRHELPWVFPNRSKTGPINSGTVNKIVTRRMGEAGIKGVHPHQFRAAFITTALDEMKLHEVQAAVGHADPRMTLRYDRRQRGQDVADRVADIRGKKK